MDGRRHYRLSLFLFFITGDTGPYDIDTHHSEAYDSG